MKKILILSTIFALFVFSASAQRGDKVRKHRIEKSFDRGQLSRGEKFKLNRNEIKFKAMKRQAMRDGKITHGERKKISKMRKGNRSKMYRSKHNSRRRLI
jgi:hypothetical protein